MVDSIYITKIIFSSMHLYNRLNSYYVHNQVFSIMLDLTYISIIPFEFIFIKEKWKRQVKLKIILTLFHKLSFLRKLMMYSCAFCLSFNCCKMIRDVTLLPDSETNVDTVLSMSSNVRNTWIQQTKCKSMG